MITIFIKKKVNERTTSCKHSCAEMVGMKLEVGLQCTLSAVNEIAGSGSSKAVWN